MNVIGQQEILEFLKKRKGEFYTITELSIKLKVSRPAIAKSIKHMNCYNHIVKSCKLISGKPGLMIMYEKEGK